MVRNRQGGGVGCGPLAEPLEKDEPSRCMTKRSLRLRCQLALASMEPRLGGQDGRRCQGERLRWRLSPLKPMATRSTQGPAGRLETGCGNTCLRDRLLIR